MRLTLPRLVLVLALLSVGSCGDDEVARDDWMLGLFSAPYLGSQDTTHATQFDIRSDGTVLVTSLSGCREDASQAEAEYVWRSEGPDAIIITDLDGSKISGVDALHVTPGPECDQLRVAYVLDGETLYDHPVFRGAICLIPAGCDGHGCTGCQLGWCDEPPEPCD